MPQCLTLTALVNSRWRTETGSSYKLQVGDGKRYPRDVSGYDTVFGFSGMPDPLPPVPTSISENSIRYKPEVENVP